MKKYFIIAGMVGIAILALGLGGLAYAQSGTPTPVPSPGYGPGMMGGWGSHRGGWISGGEGPYHAAMLDAFADVLGIGVDEIQARLESGESMWQIAGSEGFSVEEFSEMMWQVRATMLEQAVEDGTLTQEQMDAMGYRWQDGGFGPGYGGCIGYGAQGGFHRGPHSWWNSP